ncbi:hypothetical protein SBA4_2820003 [Candidatus Sulfopaludibacter sp. SbA4]|nr:hypothetical protein SBA4_2820003 [Candidatus Sulfopaludibacter sp. SbA4]
MRPWPAHASSPEAFVPLRAGVEIARVAQMLFHHLLVQLHAKAWRVRNRDVPVLDHRLRNSSHQFLPPRDEIHGVAFHRYKIIQRGGRMDGSHGGQRRSRHVDGRRDLFLLPGIVRNPLGFPAASGSAVVRVNDIDRPIVDERLKTDLPLQPEGVFAGEQRGGGVCLDLFEVLPPPEAARAEQVLQPGEAILLKSPAGTDSSGDGCAPEAGHREGRLPPDGIPHRADQLPSIFQSLVGRDAGGIESAGFIADEVGGDIHLEEREAQLLARHHALAVFLRIGGPCGVAVHAHAVAPLIAQQPPDRHAVDFAGDVVQGDIERAVAAALASRAGIRPYVLKNRGSVQRVSSYQEGFHRQGHAFVAGIAYFSQPIDILVGEDLDDRVVEVGRDPEGSNICNSQVARRGELVDRPVVDRTSAAREAARGPALTRSATTAGGARLLGPGRHRKDRSQTAGECGLAHRAPAECLLN